VAQTNLGLVSFIKGVIMESMLSISDSKCSFEPSARIPTTMRPAYLVYHSLESKHCLMHGIKLGNKNLTPKLGHSLDIVS